MKNYNISLVGRDNLGELLKLLARQVGNSYQSQFPIMDVNHPQAKDLWAAKAQVD